MFYQLDLECINVIVEKLVLEEVLFMLVVVGCYVLNSCIFYYLENILCGVGGEIQLIDGIVKLMQVEFVLVYCYQGQCYDCGFKLGYFKVMVVMGLKYLEIGLVFLEYLQEVVSKVC